MTKEKVLEVMDRYERLFQERGIRPDTLPYSLRGPSASQQLAHCHGMLAQMRTFLAEGRIEKTFRWLGFLQGILWANGWFSLEELKNHNRST